MVQKSKARKKARRVGAPDLPTIAESMKIPCDDVTPRKRVAEIVEVIKTCRRNSDTMDADWLLEVLQAPIFTEPPKSTMRVYKIDNNGTLMRVLGVVCRKCGNEETVTNVEAWKVTEHDGAAL